MDATDKNLTTSESLDLIASMINAAKGNVKDISKYFLLWGWVVVLANATMYALILMDYPRPYLAWLLVVPAWVINFYMAVQGERQKRTYTHLDRITTSLWFSFGIVAVSLVFVGHKINFQLNPVMLLLTALPTFVTGIIVRFKPLIVGGIIFWFLGVINFLLPFEYQNIISVVAFVVGYLVPGYMLKGKSGN